MDDLEHHVSNATHYIKELSSDKIYQRRSYKWFYIAKMMEGVGKSRRKIRSGGGTRKGRSGTCEHGGGKFDIFVSKLKY
ncbi:hypothetical protein IEQ34_021641 [Dendrobium chrysotoxum]|uniref:Uncharacterized protein n=1 Tax=Dendrobium chrysotoxum TaxID=161865 RepID=A0AAV7G5P7_DENCH|nr:hypothetical protein IEQ34_021641 [Dendrobium chrysotoxum]